MQKELIDATKTQPLTPEQAISLVKEAFPAFADASEDIRVALSGSGSYKVSLAVGNINLECQFYDSVWFLRLRNVEVVQLAPRPKEPSEVDVLVVEKLFLPEAISSLRQAAAEQMAVLGLVAEVEYPPVGEAFAELREKFGDCFEGFV